MDIVKIKTTIKDEQKQNPSMKILPNIAQTIFYSLLFAIGGAPTIGMWIARIQTQNPDLILTAFIGLTVIIACVLVPVVLIQNSYLLVKRNNVLLDDEIKPLSKFYFVVDLCCLASWVYFVVV